VALGYWNRPDVTAQRFRPDPRGIAGTVVYSGDIVRRDEEGLLYFVARNDRMLKAQGHRISPDEVAAAIAGCAGVGEVAVFGEDAGAMGHRIIVVVSGDLADLELPQRILRQCRARLPAYMLPSRVHVLPQLPHTQNGKIDYPTLVRDLACTDEN
jgi:acyl-coenzyme A synthetase/AMP-(fatty) acid ligase